MKQLISFSLFLIILCSCNQSKNFIFDHGAIIRGDTIKKKLSLVFTGHEYADGAYHVLQTLDRFSIKASFFLTGDFYRNPDFQPIIKMMAEGNHYIGAHSDRHLLYCDWEDRDSLLVTKEEFISDLRGNYNEMEKFEINKNKAEFFMPPYEWYNKKIATWTELEGLTLINFTPGTRSNADYTTPEMENYISSDEIYKSIIDYEASFESGLNGFILLIHQGVSPKRTDKFYLYLESLIKYLQAKEYELVRVDDLLN